jgi:hypothetical protein
MEHQSGSTRWASASRFSSSDASRCSCAQSGEPHASILIGPCRSGDGASRTRSSPRIRASRLSAQPLGEAPKRLAGFV